MIDDIIDNYKKVLKKEIIATELSDKEWYERVVGISGNRELPHEDLLQKINQLEIKILELLVKIEELESKEGQNATSERESADTTPVGEG